MDIKVLASSSKGNCYKISDGETSLLLDAGISIKEIQKGLNFQLSKVNGTFITHEHKDHSKAVLDLLKFGIDVYLSKGTVEALKLQTHHRMHEIKALNQLNVGSFEILPIDCEHDAKEPLGFIFFSRKTQEKLLYLTDTYYTRYKFNGLTHILIECNYDEDILLNNCKQGKLNTSLARRIVKSHFSLDNIIEMLKSNDLSKLKQIYLIHLSDSNSDEKKFKEEVQKLVGAEVYIA